VVVADHGRPVSFGWFLVPDAADPPGLVDLARRVERASFDLIGIQDHPYQRRYLDTFSLLAALATATERIGLFPDVANLPLRHPAMLAKAAASIDLLSGGRFELGLGAGTFWDAVAAMGGPRRTPGEAVEALEEAITLVRLLWGRSGAQAAEGDSPRPQPQRSVRFTGRHYQVAGVKPGPAPAHPIGISVGAYGPRMLGLVGRLADGWVPSSSYLPPERLPAAQARIDDAAAAAGRDPAAVRRLYNISGRIGPGGGGFLDGPAGQWVEQLLPLVTETGMDTFVLWPSEDPDRQLELFAAEVAPALRQAVAAHRGPG
jgi:alkanesulfonate monooxygenase SsuD/methylene tetrahydromethanopterin reductase-like flavin-dependent oxidoreductase (luciferase family)